MGKKMVLENVNEESITKKHNIEHCNFKRDIVKDGYLTKRRRAHRSANFMKVKRRETEMIQPCTMKLRDQNSTLSEIPTPVPILQHKSSVVMNAKDDITCHINGMPKTSVPMQLNSEFSPIPILLQQNRNPVPTTRKREFPTIDLTGESEFPRNPLNTGHQSLLPTTSSAHKIFNESLFSQAALPQNIIHHNPLSTSNLGNKSVYSRVQFRNGNNLQIHSPPKGKRSASPLQKLAIPVVDLRKTMVLLKLATLGIKSIIPLVELHNSSTCHGFYGIPVVSVKYTSNPALCDISGLGASKLLPLGKFMNLLSQQHKDDIDDLLI